MLRAIYEESWTPSNPVAPRLNFEEWLLDGCPAFLDYSHEEQAIVDAYLASERTPIGH